MNKVSKISIDIGVDSLVAEIALNIVYEKSSCSYNCIVCIRSCRHVCSIIRLAGPSSLHFMLLKKKNKLFFIILLGID